MPEDSLDALADMVATVLVDRMTSQEKPTTESAATAVEPYILRPAKQIPQFVADTMPFMGWQDLPLNRCNPRCDACKHVIEVIEDFDGPIDEDSVKAVVDSGDVATLPDIRKPPAGAMHINQHTQPAVIKQSSGKYTIVRQISFDADGASSKIKSSAAKTHAHADNIFFIKYGPNAHFCESKQMGCSACSSGWADSKYVDGSLNLLRMQPQTTMRKTNKCREFELIESAWKDK